MIEDAISEKRHHELPEALFHKGAERSGGAAVVAHAEEEHRHVKQVNEDAHRLRYRVRMADEHQQDAYPLGVIRPQLSLFLCHRFLP